MPSALDTILALQGQRESTLDRLLRTLLVLSTQAQTQAAPQAAPQTAIPGNILSNALGMSPEGIPLTPSLEEVGGGVSPGAGFAAAGLGKNLLFNTLTANIKNQIADAILRNFAPAIASSTVEAGPQLASNLLSSQGLESLLRPPSTTNVDLGKALQALRGTLGDVSKLPGLGNIPTSLSGFIPQVPIVPSTASKLAALMKVTEAPKSVFDATGGVVSSVPTVPTTSGLGNALQSINKIAGPVGLGISGALNIKDIVGGDTASGGLGLGGMALGAGIGSLTPLGPIGGAAIGGTVAKLFRGFFGGGKKKVRPDTVRQDAVKQANEIVADINARLGGLRTALETGDNLKVLNLGASLFVPTSAAKSLGTVAPSLPGAAENVQTQLREMFKNVSPFISVPEAREFLGLNIPEAQALDESRTAWSSLYRSGVPTYLSQPYTRGGYNAGPILNPAYMAVQPKINGAVEAEARIRAKTRSLLDSLEAGTLSPEQGRMAVQDIGGEIGTIASDVSSKARGQAERLSIMPSVLEMLLASNNPLAGIKRETATA